MFENLIAYIGLLLAAVALVVSLLASNRAKRLAALTPWKWDDEMVAFLHGVLASVEKQTGQPIDYYTLIQWGLNRYRAKAGKDRYYKLLNSVTQMLDSDHLRDKELVEKSKE